MGKSSRSSVGEDSGLTLLGATKYSKWFDNSECIPTGTTKPRIEKGLAIQKTGYVYEEDIRDLPNTHPMGAAMAEQLLRYLAPGYDWYYVE